MNYAPDGRCKTDLLKYSGNNISNMKGKFDYLNNFCTMFIIYT